jgi:acyl-CoA thioesterase FadM
MSEATPVLDRPSGEARSFGGQQRLLCQVPYVVRRRVLWGDCDPGGIVYTPNVLDYAIEAAEAWFESVTGLHWSRLAPDLGRGQPFVSCSVDYRQMLHCDQEFDLAVRIGELHNSAYSLKVCGSSIDGRTCFDANLVAAFIELAPVRKAVIPASIRSRMQRYRDTQDAPCAGAAP